MFGLHGKIFYTEDNSKSTYLDVEKLAKPNDM